jgi:hypothetical protein
LAPHPRGGALGRRQADVGPFTAQQHTESHVPMAPGGHGDPVARVDIVVPVGPLEALPLERPRLVAEPFCDLYTERHEHTNTAPSPVRGEVLHLGPPPKRLYSSTAVLESNKTNFSTAVYTCVYTRVLIFILVLATHVHTTDI